MGIDNGCPLARDELRFVAKISPQLIRQIVVRKVQTTPAGIINSMVGGTGLQEHVWGSLECAIRMWSAALTLRMDEVHCPPYEALFNDRHKDHAETCPDCKKDLEEIKARIPTYPFQD